MGNPEKLATLGTQDTRRRQPKQKNTTQKTAQVVTMMDTRTKPAFIMFFFQIPVLWHTISLMITFAKSQILAINYMPVQNENLKTQ
jgi:hypothetical protein